MKKTFYRLFLLLITITTSSVIFTGCKVDDLTQATRLFRPVLSDDDIVTGLTADTIPYIKVTWSQYSDANEYIVEVVASDGTDSASITTDSISCTFYNLDFDKEYNIKIHSVNTISGLESKDYVAVKTTPDFPTQLLNISSSNIIDTQVRIIWAPLTGAGTTTEYDSIKVYEVTNDSLVVSAAVTSDELNANEKIIRKLKPTTNYRVEAFLNGKYKGKKLFATTASENYLGLVFDLRGLTEDESYNYFSVSSESLYVNQIDSIIQTNPDQDITFVLQGGITYRMPTLMIPSTTGKIKFITGLSLSGLASFAVSGNFDAASNTTIGGFEFKKIFFTDAPLEDKLKTASNYGGTYLFNFGATGANIGSIKISDCTIKYKRGILRVKAATAIDSVIIDNCIIDSIAGYGVTNVDNAGASINNIKVTNSTLSNCEILFVGTKQSATPVNEVDVENCTFVYCVKDTKYIFDYNGCTINSFKIKNCVLGIGGKNPTDVLTSGIRTWSGNTQPTSDGCYYTSDYLWSLNTSTGEPIASIGTALSTTTDETFESPVNGNFNVISSELKKLVAGDPRWY